MRPSAHPAPDSSTGGRRVLLGLAGRALAELRAAAPDGAPLEAVSHPHLRGLDLAPGDRLYIAAFADDRQLLLIGRLDVGSGGEPGLVRSGHAATPVAYGRRVPHGHARALEDGSGRGLRFARAAAYEMHPVALVRPFELDARSAGLLDELLPEPRGLPDARPAAATVADSEPGRRVDGALGRGFDGFRPAPARASEPPAAGWSEDPRLTPVGEALPSRVANVLRREGFETLGDLQRLSPPQLDAMRGMGARGARAVRGRLARAGIEMLGNGMQERRGTVGATTRTSVPPPASAGAPMAKPASARAQAMAQLRAQGETLEQIGRKFKLTRERVRQILKSQGDASARDASQARRQTDADAAGQRAEEILAAYRQGHHADAIADALGLSRPAVRDLTAQRATPADRVARTKARVDASPGRGTTYTDQELVDAVAHVAERLGRTPTASDYAYLAQPLGLPSAPTIQTRLGWAATVRAAGLTPREAARRGYRRRWTEEACWEALRRAVGELGRIPTVQQYEAHAASRDDLPSHGTVRNRLGRWSEVRLKLAAEDAGPPGPSGATADASAPRDPSSSPGLKTSQLLNPGDVWTREQLCERFAITDATIRTGIFRPAGHDSLWLFVTRDKAAGQTQYRDELVGDVLAWDGQTEGRKDHLIIEHAKLGLEVLLFYRTSKREHPGAGFTYHGPFRYETHSGSRPASFVLRRESAQ